MLKVDFYFYFQKAMKDKDISIEELRWYHSEIGFKAEPSKNN